MDLIVSVDTASAKPHLQAKLALEKLDIKALARHHADLMLYALAPGKTP